MVNAPPTAVLYDMSIFSRRTRPALSIQASAG
jgi:hypothetical protein